VSADENIRVARRLYKAFAEHDRDELVNTLTLNFHARIAEGMPEGLGGEYVGAETTLREVWARVFALFDVVPAPDELLPVGDNCVVVLGRYEGAARQTGRSLSAAFVHVLRVDEGRISELVQVTDTACWHQALDPGLPRG
jgi:2-(1,2-epoxy-1,2-dihydrophenyl)acetyl-CoA isomerase